VLVGGDVVAKDGADADLLGRVPQRLELAVHVLTVVTPQRIDSA